MPNRIVSVGDDFALPPAVKVLDTHLPTRLQDTALSATFALKSELTEAGLKVVYHEDNAGYVRPATAGPVLWIGSVTPTNRVAGDQYFIASAEPVPFNPLSLSPDMWFDSQTLATGTLATWSDLSGNTRNLSVLGGTGAVVTDAALNGKRAAVFGGSTWYESAALTGFSGSDVTVVLVGQANAGDEYFLGGQDNENRFELGHNATNWFASRATVQRQSAGGANANPHKFFLTFGADASVKLEIDGTQVISDNTITATSALNTMILGARRRPGSTVDASTALNGAVGELMIFKRALTSGEKADLLAHLTTKWGF